MSDIEQRIADTLKGLIAWDGLYVLTSNDAEYLAEVLVSELGLARVADDAAIWDATAGMFLKMGGVGKL